MNYYILNNNYLKDIAFLNISSNIKIGIFGGSFYPPHLGHLYISNQAKRILNLDLVLWMVTPQNPIKKNYNNIYSLKQRIKLCEDITKNHNYIKIICIEDSFNLHYSYLILRLIKRLSNPSNTFYWIMGEDNLENICRFSHWQEIITHNNCAIFARNPKTFQIFFKKYAILQEKKKLKLFLIPKNNLSSTKIREKIKVTNYESS